MTGDEKVRLYTDKDGTLRIVDGKGNAIDYISQFQIKGNPNGEVTMYAELDLSKIDMTLTPAFALDQLVELLDSYGYDVVPKAKETGPLNMRTVCPHCGQVAESVMGVGDTDFPKDGNMSVCLKCGEIVIFDFTQIGCLRVPTASEERRIMESPGDRALVDRVRELRDKRMERKTN